MADFKRFIAAAHARGIRVITELVINHTSDQHPWFQRARKAKPGSPARNFYVWSDNDQKYSGTRIIFLDTERSNWTWDPVAGAYYWHRFYSHQPDLNFDNPQVLEAVLGVMRFWLDLGVDGLRLDAVPYLIEREGTNNENLPETHDVLRRIRAEIDKSYPGRMLLAEANQWPEDTKDYFGQGDECHMAFHFPLMPRMYMALAREDRFPITDIMRQTPQIPENCQWAIFLRNHDELTLEMVTDSRARLSVGDLRGRPPRAHQSRHPPPARAAARARPPPHRADELPAAVDAGHAGHLLRRRDRHGRQHPSRRSRRRAHADAVVARPQRRILARRSGGARAADPDGSALRLRDGQCRGAAARSRIPCCTGCAACWRSAAVTRRSGAARCAFSIRGTARFWRSCASTTDEIILCVANVSRAPQAVELDLSEFAGRVPVELSGGSLFPPIGQLTYLLTLPPYGFYWFVLAAQSEPPAWHTPAPEPMPEYITLVTRNRIADALATADGAAFVRDVLPVLSHEAALVLRQGPDHQVDQLQVSRAAARMAIAKCCWPRSRPRPTARPAAGSCRCRSSGTTSRRAALPSQLALARVRRGRRTGLLTDAFALPAFAHAGCSRALADRSRIETAGGHDRLRADRGRRSECCGGPSNAPVLWLTAEQSNSSLIVNDAVMLKMFRKVSAGDASRSGDEPLPDRAGVRQYAADARRGRAGHQRRASAARSRWRRASCAIRAMPGPGLLDQFNRALDDIATREADRRRNRGRGRRLHRHCRRDRAAARRDARRAGACRRRRRLRARDRERARCRSMGRSCGRAARARVRLAQEAIELGERDGRGRGQAAAGAAGSADARAAQARQGGHRHARKPASTATSTSARCWSPAATSTS